MEWIKVSERKPADGERVWITYEVLSPDHTLERYTEEARYDADRDEFEVWDAWLLDSYDEPRAIAWMPIPKPYDGD